MIIVIADDFTGAAELAGISLQYGLTTEVFLGNILVPGADVLVISTNSRSLDNENAVTITADIVTSVLKLEPELIYKKIDSVLRGHVIDEVKIQMHVMGYNKAFILAANPSLGRTIRDGEYFVEGRRLNETGFASDPEFPVSTSSVQQLLGSSDIKILDHKDQLPLTGIVAGEAETTEDMIAWADRIDTNWVLAGAGDFYNVLLNKTFSIKTLPNAGILLPHLYVCGTSFSESNHIVSQINNEQHCVMYLSERMLRNETADDPIWFEKLADLLRKQQKAVIAIDKKTVPPAASALSLRTVMAKAVKYCLENETVKELFIDGGSTGAAVLHELNIEHLVPVNVLQRGVVRMKAAELFITVKPGSYKWPQQIMNLYFQN